MMKKIIILIVTINYLSSSSPSNEKKICSIEQFSCHSRAEECIALNWMCDDNADCSDGSDEEECHEICRSDEFTCNNKRCIQRQWLCDYDDDCGDNSDELHCNYKKCFQEKVFSCDRSTCITSLWKCDGDFDCPNMFDEKNCDYINQTRTFVSCSDQEVLCDDYITCIHKSWLCDGDEDCPSGLDELLFKCKSTSCKTNDMECKINESCTFDLIVQDHCNKNIPCSNKNKENNCERTLHMCDLSRFECIDGLCNSLETICDKNFDCKKRKKEMEMLCKTNECSTQNGGCSQLCVNLPIGRKCACQSGYTLADNKTCIDLNECLELGSCSQICKNEEGSFNCSCVKGYAIDPKDHKRCKAVEGHASLLFTRGHDIRKIGLDRQEMTALVNSTVMATALDFVFRTGMIFWSDSIKKKIFKAPIDEGNEKELIIDGEIIVSDGLAVDWIYDHIYWIDTKKNTINVANFDGNMRKTLFKDLTQEPKSIVLNPVDGWMFWTNWGNKASLEKAGMDGSDRMRIITNNIKRPNGLTLDLIGKRIFWTDAKMNSISSCNYDGSTRKTVLHSPKQLKHPFSITIFEDLMYWTDWNKGTIFKANKFSGLGVEKMMSVSIQHPMIVKVYHPYKQSDGINYCQVINGHCSHLCLPKPKKNITILPYSCACPDDLVLSEDQLMCTKKGTMEALDVEIGPEKAFNGIAYALIIGSTFIGLSIFSIVVVLLCDKYSSPHCTSMNFHNPMYKRIA